MKKKLLKLLITLIIFCFFSPICVAQQTITPKYELSDNIIEMSVIPFYYMDKGVIPSEKKGKVRSTAIILCENSPWSHLWIELFIFDSESPEESAVCTAFIYNSVEKKYLYENDFDYYEEVLKEAFNVLEKGKYSAVQFKKDSSHQKGIQYPLVRRTDCKGL